MSKMLSVIMSVYNGENFVPKAIEQLENCNHDIADDLEVILVNDGSKDHSLEVCNALKEKYPNIVVYDKPNGGLASGRKFGFEHATGKYITFHDQDDHVEAGYKPFLELIEARGGEILMSNFYEDVAGKKSVNMFLQDERVFNHDEAHLMMLNLVDQNVLCTQKELDAHHLPRLWYSVWNQIFLREFLVKNQVQIMQFHSQEDDMLTTFQSLSCVHTLVTTPKPWYCFVIRAESMSHKAKYIADFFNKRQRQTAWTLDFLKRNDVPQDRLEKFARVMDTQTAIWTFYYESVYSDYKTYRKVMSRYSELRPFLSADESRVGRRGKIYIPLLRHHCYWLAYILNRYILKK